jgi:hypothetical protein
MPDAKHEPTSSSMQLQQLFHQCNLYFILPNEEWLPFVAGAGPSGTEDIVNGIVELSMDSPLAGPSPSSLSHCLLLVTIHL